MKIDFKQGSLEGGNKIKAGTHIVKIVSIEPRESQAGNKYLQFVFVNKAGQEFKENFMLRDNMLWKLGQLCRAAGWGNEELYANGVDTAGLLGRVVVATRTVKGKRSFVNDQGETIEFDEFETVFSSQANEDDTSSGVTEELPF